LITASSSLTFFELFSFSRAIISIWWFLSFNNSDSGLGDFLDFSSRTFSSKLLTLAWASCKFFK